jgi:receptor protein-tyrosine kinase
MSRVHDALRKAAQTGSAPPPVADAITPPVLDRASPTAAAIGTIDESPSISTDFLDRIAEVPFNPSPDGLVIDVTRPHEAPMEEFRTLRTRLNHMQTLQPIRSVVITSASPAEGKSFAAMNLAICQAQLAGSRILLADFDFRRPIVHNLLQIDRSPGITDFLMRRSPLEDVIKRVEGTNLYVMPAGEAVMNPLELLNLSEVKQILTDLPNYFDWVILDTPPLLFAADANLLATMCHGTMLVVRIGATTIDTITRAMQSLCENNVLGIIVNGARRGELYSKYTYYHSYYTPAEPQQEPAADAEKVGAE